MKYDRVEKEAWVSSRVSLAIWVETHEVHIFRSQRQANLSRIKFVCPPVCNSTLILETRT